MRTWRIGGRDDALKLVAISGGDMRNSALKVSAN